MPYYSNKDRFAWIDEMPLSEKIIWLVKIRCYIREFFDATVTPKVPNNTDIYEYCKRKIIFSKKFWNPSAFSHFMRLMHQQGYLKQVIPYCHVDTSKYEKFGWEFYRPARIVVKRADLISGDANDSLQLINSGRYKYEASDKTLLMSTDELHIWEELQREDFLEVEYEKKFYYKSEFKLPDFTIKVNDSEDPFIWEHFGMKEDSNYFVTMANKIEWYSRAGLKHIDDGGRLIFTIRHHDDDFHHDVVEIINNIKSHIKPLTNGA